MSSQWRFLRRLLLYFLPVFLVALSIQLEIWTWDKLHLDKLSSKPNTFGFLLMEIYIAEIFYFIIPLQIVLSRF